MDALEGYLSSCFASFFGAYGCIVTHSFPSFQISAQVLRLLSFCKHCLGIKPINLVGNLSVDITKPWCVLDGVWNDSIDGCGFFLHFDYSNYFHLKENVGKEINYGEFIALFLLLKFSLNHGIESLRFFGDSSLIINYLSIDIRLHTILLLPLANVLSRTRATNSERFANFVLLRGCRMARNHSEILQARGCPTNSTHNSVLTKSIWHNNNIAEAFTHALI